MRVGIAPQPLDLRDRFLYHKTTHREIYQRSLAARPDCDDMILWNRSGEAAATCFGNLVVSRGGRFFTPPVSAGLLAGTFREWLLSTGAIAEDVITLDEVRAGAPIYVVNSLRKWRPAVVLAAAGSAPARRRALAAVG